MHSTSRPPLDAKQDFDPSRDVPDFLQKYLTTTDNPFEIYKCVSQTNENRVRLLTRRFFNQIQYGCKNPACIVPTCLSYRERVATGPVRPHNDVTARALAVRCVEQYANRCRDIDRAPRKDKGKKKQTLHAQSSKDGLCYNEPVVPWYADAREYLAKTSAAASRTRAFSSESTGRTRSPPRLRRQRSPSKPSLGQVQSNGAPLEPVKVAKVAFEDDPFMKTATTEFSHPPILPKLAAHPDSTVTNGSHVLPPPSHNKATPKPVLTDPASFAQFLFSTSRLQLEDDPPSKNSLTSVQASLKNQATVSLDSALNRGIENAANATEEAAGATNRSDGVAAAKVETRYGEDSSTSQYSPQPTDVARTYTFKLLPPSAILYLRSLVIQHEDKTKQQQSRLQQSLIDDFIDQSFYYVFTSPDNLLASASTWDSVSTGQFRRGTEGKPDQAESVFDTEHPPTLPRWVSTVSMCDIIFRTSISHQGQQGRILGHLLRLLNHAYVAPHWLATASKRSGPFRENSEVAHLIVLVINIASPIFDGRIDNDDKYEKFALAVPTRSENDSNLLVGTRLADSDFSVWSVRPELSRLLVALADLLAHRIAIDIAIKSRRTRLGKSTATRIGVIKTIVKFILNPPTTKTKTLYSRLCSKRLLRFMQTVLVTNWDRSPTIQRTSPVGGALEMLKGLYQSRQDFNLPEFSFEMQFIPDALDEIDMPFAWLNFKPNATTMHILQFPFLFPATDLVRYFRSLNLKTMKQSHEKAMGTYANGKSQLIFAQWRVNNVTEVLDKTRAHMARYFVMTIRREHMLEDAIGQIWRRERQELTRPLKVRMGVDEGELGLDHGGVQQEFFRLVFAQAFDAQYGMFDIDATTRTTWFKPGSVEPLYKYEALGLLMSLAIYNGVTVPTTMPLAFYRKILELPVTKVEHIEDGWPDLARSFKQMLEWEDGDVGDVMYRTYEFSYEAFGRRVNIDMTKKGILSSLKHSKRRESDLGSNIDFVSTDPEEAPLVTNANREAFVKDYIIYLTSTAIQAQFNSFLSGLYTLLSKQSLALFPPSTLKLLFEGHPTSQPIDIDEWRTATTYEDYTASDRIILWFWEVLRQDFTQTQLRKLLEFVTASDRIPVTGWSGITFIIQRNAAGNEWLPGSSTCYGRLFLPEYSSKEVLKEKLTTAVETSLGFGMV